MAFDDLRPTFANKSGGQIRKGRLGGEVPDGLQHPLHREVGLVWASASCQHLDFLKKLRFNYWSSIIDFGNGPAQAARFLDIQLKYGSVLTLGRL